MRTLNRFAALVGLAGLTSAASMGQTFLGPTPYLCSGDSPWPLASPGYFLETFEDGMLNTLGVTGAGNIAGPGGLADSVDCDDGVINGSGTNGRTFFGNGGAGLTFTFDPAAFGGRLPQRVGIVWTDGVHENTPNSVHFRAFGPGDVSLGERTGTHADLVQDGQTAEDRFYGIEHAPGISKIWIFQTAGCCGIEVDHLQYGFISDGCPGDLNNDGFVDDTDFTLFVAGYNILDCADPAMPPSCPADLNGDGFVDDADFQAFVPAYNQLECP